MRHIYHDRSFVRPSSWQRLRCSASDSCINGFAVRFRRRNMPKHTVYPLNVLFLLMLFGAATIADAQVDRQRAQEFFKEAKALCERDSGRLWGVSVCAPMVIGDIRTKTFATSQPPPDAPRPSMVGLVNGPVQWGGVTWAAYAWDDLVNRTAQKPE